MNLKKGIRGAGAILLLITGLGVTAQEATSDKPAAQKPTESQPAAQPKSTVVTLPPIVVTAPAPSGYSSVENSTPPIKERYTLPNATHSTDAAHIGDTVNLIDPEDAVKYFPGILLRKRAVGDPQTLLTTRTWGVTSSARTLVYADDILLSALVGNNTTNTAPRWSLITPEEISRVDFLYGPYAAAYPGNSEGGVLLFTTKMPDKLIVDGTQTEAFQTFSLYKTSDTYRTDETSVVLGNKNGDVSWLIGGGYENSYTQPLYIVTSSTAPAGTTGTIPALNKTGAPASVVGAGGILHIQNVKLNAKLAWDITPTLKATFDTGFYFNDTDSTVQSYLQGTTTGAQTFAGISGFASDNFNFYEEHLANSFSLKSDTQDVFDWDFSVSNYYYLDDVQKNPLSASATTTGFSTNGTITSFTGTNWQNGDLKGVYRPTGPGGEHEISFGIHADRYNLENPTYATPDWTSSTDATGTQYSDGKGTTYTEALWAQDAWRFTDNWKLTSGGRLENWQAEDGFNLATTRNAAGAITASSATSQPNQEAVRFSPKVALDWTPSKEWETTLSLGQAYRFPTVEEMYQTVTSGPAIYVPNPDLRPEDDFSAELALDRHFDDGNIRLSVFNDYVQNAMISQTNFVGGTTPLTFTSNVNAIRITGVELDAQKDDVLLHGLDLFGSVIYANSEILSDPSFLSATGQADAAGKQVPYVPDWRATFGTTYHPDDHWALTAALRYSGKQYSTLDNSDSVSGVYGAFDSYFVVDLHAQYKVNDNFSLDAGIDNVNDEKYFFFHPFPQRTYTAALKVIF